MLVRWFNPVGEWLDRSAPVARAATLGALVVLAAWLVVVGLVLHR